MSLDATKYPMLSDLAHRPTCSGCDGNMVRVERAGVGEWLCLDWDCDAYPETDAQLDNRLTAEAEAAHERIYTQGL